jgi:hypothetical protein
MARAQTNFRGKDSRPSVKVDVAPPSPTPQPDSSAPQTEGVETREPQPLPRPEPTATKATIAAWLTENQVEVPEGATKAELVALLGLQD